MCSGAQSTTCLLPQDLALQVVGEPSTQRPALVGGPGMELPAHEFLDVPVVT